jgi:hypothetical protein
MIDPANITNFNQTKEELEEVLLFWVCAAGKTAQTAAKGLDEFLEFLRISVGKYKSPFTLIRRFLNGIPPRRRAFHLAKPMRLAGIGCYNNKANTFVQLAYSKFDLKKCVVTDLEKIKGIGPKTARCFLIHSRPDQKYAGLDTHLLKWLKEKGHKVPKATPTGKRYRELEGVFLEYVEESGKTVAELDLEIWNQYSQKV